MVGGLIWGHVLLETRGDVPPRIGYICFMHHSTMKPVSKKSG